MKFKLIKSEKIYFPLRIKKIRSMQKNTSNNKAKYTLFLIKNYLKNATQE